MVKIRMIKAMPDFPKGDIGEMRNKEHAKMWVEEGYAEYVDDKEKVSPAPLPKEDTTKADLESQTPPAFHKEDFNSFNLEQLNNYLLKLESHKLDLKESSTKEDKIKVISLNQHLTFVKSKQKDLIKEQNKQLNTQSKEDQKKRVIEQTNNQLEQNNSLLTKSLSGFFKRYNIYLIKLDSKPLYYLFDNLTQSYYAKNEQGLKSFVYTELLNSYISKSELYLLLDTDLDKTIDDKIFKFLIEEKHVKIVEDAVFKPIDKKEFMENNKLYFNLYSTPTLLKNILPKSDLINKDSFPDIKELLFHLCNNEIKSYEWFLKRLAITIQKPSLKVPTYLILQGKGGSGKGTLFKLLLTAIWKEYTLETSVNSLTNNFNSQFQTKIWIMIDEAQKEKNSKSDLDSTIKRLTGSSIKEIEGKNKDSKSVESYENYIFCSNKTDLGLKLDKWDRRAVVFGFSETLGGSKENASRLFKKYENTFPKEIPSFISYLKNLEFDFNDVMSPIDTPARDNLISMGMNNFDLFDTHLNNVFNGLDLQDILSTKDVKEEILIARKHFHQLIIGNKEGIYLSTKGIYKLYVDFCSDESLNKVREQTFYADLYNKTGIQKALNTNGERKRVLIRGIRHDVFSNQSFFNHFSLKGNLDTPLHSITEAPTDGLVLANITEDLI